MGDMDYYIDIEAYCDFVTEQKGGVVEEKLLEKTTNDNGETITKETVSTVPSPLEVNAVKYELISMLFESLMRHAPEGGDNGLGITKVLKDASLDFNVAFNTLEYYNIIKNYE